MSDAIALALGAVTSLAVVAMVALLGSKLAARGRARAKRAERGLMVATLPPKGSCTCILPIGQPMREQDALQRVTLPGVVNGTMWTALASCTMCGGRGVPLPPPPPSEPLRHARPSCEGKPGCPELPIVRRQLDRRGERVQQLCRACAADPSLIPPELRDEGKPPFVLTPLADTEENRKAHPEAFIEG